MFELLNREVHGGAIEGEAAFVRVDNTGAIAHVDLEIQANGDVGVKSAVDACEINLSIRQLAEYVMSFYWYVRLVTVRT